MYFISLVKFVCLELVSFKITRIKGSFNFTVLRCHVYCSVSLSLSRCFVVIFVVFRYHFYGDSLPGITFTVIRYHFYGDSLSLLRWFVINFTVIRYQFYGDSLSLLRWFVFITFTVIHCITLRRLVFITFMVICFHIFGDSLSLSYGASLPLFTVLRNIFLLCFVMIF